MARRSLVLGILSDTHGLVRPEALSALTGVFRIIHAGDIGAPEVLDALSALAPVTAVRGNNDTGAWARALPETAVVEVGGVRLYVLHDEKELALEPAAEGFAAVIAGHSHRPRIARKDGVLHVNPGSAGPRRFSLPVTVARLTIEAGRVAAELVEVSAPAPARAARPRRRR